MPQHFADINKHRRAELTEVHQSQDLVMKKAQQKQELMLLEEPTSQTYEERNDPLFSYQMKRC